MPERLMLYDQDAVEARPQLRGDRLLNGEFIDIAVDTVMAAHFLRSRGVADEGIDVTTIHMAAGYPHDKAGRVILGDYTSRTRRTRVFMQNIVAYGRQQLELDTFVLDEFVSRTASEVLAHELTHRTLDGDPAMEHADRRFKKGLETRTKLVRGATAASAVLSLSLLGADAPMFVNLGGVVMTDLIALQLFRRYHLELDDRAYLHHPEERACHLAELSAPPLVSTRVRPLRAA